jgi:hypothetical protein
MFTNFGNQLRFSRQTELNNKKNRVTVLVPRVIRATLFQPIQTSRPKGKNPQAKHQHSVCHSPSYRGFYLYAIKKMVLTCVSLKRLLAHVCHRPKFLCPLHHSVPTLSIFNVKSPDMWSDHLKVRKCPCCLEFVLACLPVLDRLCFPPICTAWQSAAASTGSAPLSPWLMLPFNPKARGRTRRGGGGSDANFMEARGRRQGRGRGVDRTQAHTA